MAKMTKRPKRIGGRAAHRWWVLKALVELGGHGSKQAVCKWIYPRLKPQLKDRDFEPVETGELTWENEIAWARDDLVKGGMLKAESPRNLWEISDAGRNWLKSHLRPPPIDDPIGFSENANLFPIIALG
jgi:hypothetical protein